MTHNQIWFDTPGVPERRDRIFYGEEHRLCATHLIEQPGRLALFREEYCAQWVLCICPQNLFTAVNLLTEQRMFCIQLLHHPCMKRTLTAKEKDDLAMRSDGLTVNNTTGCITHDVRQ